MKTKVLLVSVLLVTLILTFGCASKVNVEEVRSYADPMTENLLVAMNESNYANFSKDLDSRMKKAIPESSFPNLISQINGKIGKYVTGSKVFQKALKEKQYIKVVYTAQFTEEPKGVIVTVVFVKVNGEMKVAGLWFNSPKLRKK